MTFFLGSGKNPICCDPNLVEFWGGPINQPQDCPARISVGLSARSRFEAPKLSKKKSWNPQVAFAASFHVFFLREKNGELRGWDFRWRKLASKHPSHRSWTSWSTCGKQLRFFLAPLFEALNTMALRQMYLLIKRRGKNKIKYIQYIYNMYTLQWFFSFLSATSATLQVN